MFNKIKAIKDLRSQAKHMQQQLSQIIVEETSHGITLKIDGNQQILSINIQEDLLGNKEKLEQALKSAFESTMKKLQKNMAMKMKDLGGLDALKNLGF